MKTGSVNVCDEIHASLLFVVSVPGMYMMLSVGH